MTNVVTELRFVAVGTTRDDCIAALDEVALHALDKVGGAPWMMPDDDIKRIEAGAIAPTLADRDGFCYLGVRSYQFRGPAVVVGHQTYHDGFKVQHGAEEGG